MTGMLKNHPKHDCGRDDFNNARILSIDPSAHDDGTDENPYITFRLKIHLKEAHGLVIRDASGSSDPYVKFKYQEKTMYKSNTVYRSLNPNWDEEFAFLIDDPTSLLKLEVFDYDRFMMDDSMGSTSIDLSTLRLFQAHDLKLTLEGEDNSEEYMGYVQLTITITPLTESQKNEFLSKATRGVITEAAKRSNKAVSVWLSAVNIVLVEAKLSLLNLPTIPDPYVKFKLGSEKYKSKNMMKTYEPKWIEQFDLHIYDENFQTLDVMIYDKNGNTIIGKCSIDLKEFEREKTEENWYQLEDDCGSILLLMTISGTSVSTGTVADLNDYVGNRNDIVNKYGLNRSLNNIKDVGHLTVKVFRAENLASADINGKNDCGSILLLMTISGTSVSTGTVADLNDYVGNRNDIVNKYGLNRSMNNIKDVGHLTVKVFRAENLASADINGKSDPFCVLELVNARLQTHTEYKTLNPVWNKLFTFAVKDIHEVLEVTVYDEDPNKKFEFLGKVAIPLLKIRNCEKRWYNLKDRKLFGRVKGRILLEMDFLWNPVKAAVRTFKPKEKKFIVAEQKFKPSMLINSVNRLKDFGNYLISCKAFMDDCLSWKSYPKSICAFLVSFLKFYDWANFGKMWDN
uniref:C2 domain-containing protein n=1 Tax=Panagrolaimus sp. JU765 TaxID=591449 RepID=A0AC34RPM4_9BILA